MLVTTLFCNAGQWTNYPVATTLAGTETFLFGTATNNQLIVATNMASQLAIFSCHLTTSTATSGTVTAVTNYQSETIYLSNSSTISSITIALPTTTIIGQIFRIHSKAAVTTLSVTGTSFADSAVTSLTAGQTIGYQAQNASGAYIRIQ